MNSIYILRMHVMSVIFGLLMGNLMLTAFPKETCVITFKVVAVVYIILALTKFKWKDPE